ncbi:MAG: DUF2807 domain-containing protein [Rikenellaceae bacterium]
MKRFFLILMFVSLCGASAMAQMTLETKSTSESNAKLSHFKAVNINASMLVTLKRVDDPSQCRVAYDLMGNTDSRFEFLIDKDSTLVVKEKSSTKRLKRSEMTIYYHTLSDIKISKAIVTLEGELECGVVDIRLSSSASFTGKIEAKDMRVTATGGGVLKLEGECRYIDVEATLNSLINLGGVESMSSRINASHGAQVMVSVSERIETRATAGAIVKYKGNPSIKRNSEAFIGGDVFHVDTF